jgi:hypothetical protein
VSRVHANHFVDDAVAVVEVRFGPNETKGPRFGARGANSAAGRRFGGARRAGRFRTYTISSGGMCRQRRMGKRRCLLPVSAKSAARGRNLPTSNVLGSDRASGSADDDPEDARAGGATGHACRVGSSRKNG